MASRLLSEVCSPPACERSASTRRLNSISCRTRPSPTHAPSPTSHSQSSSISSACSPSSPPARTQAASGPGTVRRGCPPPPPRAQPRATHHGTGASRSTRRSRPRPRRRRRRRRVRAASAACRWREKVTARDERRKVESAVGGGAQPRADDIVSPPRTDGDPCVVPRKMTTGVRVVLRVPTRARGCIKRREREKQWVARRSRRRRAWRRRPAA